MRTSATLSVGSPTIRLGSLIGATILLIVALTVAGESAPAIAAALFLSERTVESHLARVYVKLGVHSKPELARRAAQLGLAPGSP